MIRGPPEDSIRCGIYFSWYLSRIMNEYNKFIITFNVILNKRFSQAFKYWFIH